MIVKYVGYRTPMLGCQKRGNQKPKNRECGSTEPFFSVAQYLFYDARTHEIYFIDYTYRMCIIMDMKNSTHQRINITLPAQTLHRIDQIAEHGDRSRLIDTAVNLYLAQRTRGQLRKALREGAEARATRDREIAAALFDLDDPWETRRA
jgi:hypothetical protein